MRRADRYLNAVDSELLAYSLLAKIQRDTKNAQRVTLVRNCAKVHSCEDRRDLVSILIAYEAADQTRRQVEGLEGTDELYSQILFHSLMLELTIDYAYKWIQARKYGYKKQLATFIQSEQADRDGSTVGDPNVWPHGWYEDLISQEDLESDLSYVHLMDTSRDYRWDEEHERRAALWQSKNL